ncbi:DASH family cryptochrome [Bernardetia sp.]|uniref:DASH family cryptochrome n=1 Tax=Bernardetia sp. TaxID=1937974 RepID=UPI0025C71F71|nr:DASH family cryptochrome [Bernardetia sp.]
MKNTLIWLRNDLRLNDNPALKKAFQTGNNVFVVYIFDDHYFQKTELNLPKTGIFRANFLLESIQDLKKRLQEYNSDLFIYKGKTEEILPKLAKKLEVETVFSSKEITFEEINLKNKVKGVLEKVDVKLDVTFQQTLFEEEELPFTLSDLPNVFTNFRKKVEKELAVSKLIPIPKELEKLKETEENDFLNQLETTEVPTLKDFDFSASEINSLHNPKAVLKYEGGETAALERLNYYLFKSDLLQTYKETRNGLLGGDYSSKFSAWLANGCISAKTIWNEVERYENEVKSNKSTYWLKFELLWREYFKWIAKKYGNKIFLLEGMKDDENLEKIYGKDRENLKKHFQNDQNKKLFEKWKTAKTGIPFIDANMKELNETGFMSNRGRQNVASFLVKDLKLDWRWGASYFETKLIDYDVTSNWANWAYVAGVGNDPRENRYFNIIKQAKDYDENADFVKHWLPQLSDVPINLVHTLYRLTPKELEKYEVSLGGNYPYPIVKL